MRSARKVMLEERERDAAARLRDEEEEEEEVEENGDGEVVDPASVALPESPMVGGVSLLFIFHTRVSALLRAEHKLTSSRSLIPSYHCRPTVHSSSSDSRSTLRRVAFRSHSPSGSRLLQRSGLRERGRRARSGRRGTSRRCCC